jgi:bis(5'-nucleosyl)-tetraphosphatase (symmetrical)
VRLKPGRIQQAPSGLWRTETPKSNRAAQPQQGIIAVASGSDYPVFSLIGGFRLSPRARGGYPSCSASTRFSAQQENLNSECSNAVADQGSQIVAYSRDCAYEIGHGHRVGGALVNGMSVKKPLALNDSLDSLERSLDVLLGSDDERSQSPRYTYAIGDVQGCFDDLLRLLDKIDFDPAQDRLWFTGDLVNKGPNSLNILRFVKGLGDSAITVLGNHDLYLLAVGAGLVTDRKSDTLAPILAAHDCEDLLFWLRHQPVLHHDDTLGYTMVHAGLPPQWDLANALTRAGELETVLQNTDYPELLATLDENKPERWSGDLDDLARLRFIVNCFTQLRYCDCKGRLDLSGERRTATTKKRSMPWFQVPGRAHSDMKIIFGHWASLDTKKIKTAGVYPLDTGCSNKGKFTALRLEDERIFTTRCKIRSHPGLG